MTRLTSKEIKSQLFQLLVSLVIFSSASIDGQRTKGFRDCFTRAFDLAPSQPDKLFVYIFADARRNAQESETSKRLQTISLT